MAARDNAGITHLAINGVDQPLMDTVPLSPNTYTRSTNLGANRPLGTRKEVKPVMIGPIVLQITEAVNIQQFVDWHQAGTCVNVQVELTDGRTASMRNCYIVGDGVDVDPREGQLTFSLESADPEGMKFSV